MAALPEIAVVSAGTLDNDSSSVNKEDFKVSNSESDNAIGFSDKPVSAFAILGQKDALRLFWKSTLICCLAAFGACNDGYAISLMGQINANKGFVQVMGDVAANGTVAINAKHISAWAACYQAMYIVFQISATFINDLFGRKPTFFLLCACLMGATLCEMFATTWQTWAGAKVLGGIGFGLGQATLTSYISEIAPTPLRGSLLCLYQFFTALGQTTAAIALKIIASTAPYQYKKAIYSEWVFSGIFLIFAFILPESPRYYARKGHADKAKAVMRRLNGKVPGYDVDHEYSVLAAEIKEGKLLADEQKQISLITLFRGTNLRRTFISWLPFSAQQILGSSVVFANTSYFFQQAGLKDAFSGVMAVYAILLGFVTISFFFVERWGRRPLLLTGGAICSASLVVVGALGCVTLTTAVSNAMISFLCVWVAAYSLTVGPVAFVYLGESSTVLLRAKTVGMAAGGSGAFSLIFNYCTPILLSTSTGGAGWGARTAFLFAGLGSITTVIMFFTIPETKNRSYQELDILFGNRVPARMFASTTTGLEKIQKEEAEKVRDVRDAV